MFKKGDRVIAIKTDFTDKEWEKVGRILDVEFNIGDNLEILEIDKPSKALLFLGFDCYYPESGFKLENEFYENLTLPEYWKLKITSESLQDISNWRTNVFGFDGYINNKTYIYSYGTTRKPLIEKSEYKEISYAQFKEVILKNAITKFTNKEASSMMKLLAKLDIK